MTGRLASPARFEPWVVVGLLLVAAWLRLPGLEARGTWDGDQGHDMLVLRAFVQDGAIPLLGPPTSIGDVHHGAWYYYLLSPAAFLTGGDAPLAVVTVIAIAGIAAVGVVWWLARSISGPWAGLVAGLLLAVSGAAVDESTFIWNPNLIGLASAVALAGTWQAWRGGSPRWWLVAALGVAVTMQCHVLGVALLPTVLVPLILDARRRRIEAAVWLGLVVIAVVAYLPLIVNELTTSFSEVGAALAYLAGGRTADAPALPIRFVIVGLRIVSWPLVGLITTAFVPAFLATIGVIVATVWLARAPSPHEPGRRWVARWLGWSLLWSTLFLTVAAPSLASVVPGLPNDHYHAFADPMVVVLVGLAVAALVDVARAHARAEAPAGAGGVGRARAAGLIAIVVVVGLAAWNLTHQPPAVHPDGGWPGGELAGDRIDAALTAAGISRDQAVTLRSIPDFKSTEAVAYPLVRLDRAIVAETPRDPAPGSVDPATTEPAGWVLLCDDLFRVTTGADCGGPAEDAAAASTPGFGPLLDRFEAAPGRWVSVYGAA